MNERPVFVLWRSCNPSFFSFFFFASHCFFLLLFLVLAKQDSTTALTIAETLSSLCKRNRTVAMTIHQPSTRVLDVFDKVMFLSRSRMVSVADKTLLGCIQYSVSYCRRCTLIVRSVPTLLLRCTLIIISLFIASLC